MKFEFDKDLQASVIYFILGGLMGYASVLIGNNLFALAIALVVLFASRSIVQLALGIKPGDKSEKGEVYGQKWWLAHGVYPYIVFWIFVWILSYNLF